ncbi:hypothetical protein ACH5RR_026958 [Cinchona calisaya]|uniref:Glycosyltransferase 61 catalytic domain-containing protein n=1 Tax=Cinchona calisaya TaxID=153742 RepID=A0ABD2Z5Y2_9GENT
MKMEEHAKHHTKNKQENHSIKFIICLLFLFSLLTIFHIQSFTSDSSSYSSSISKAFFPLWRRGVSSVKKQSTIMDSTVDKLRQSVTFLPLKDLRFSETAMTGNTWFMSSLNDTHDKNEAEYMYFPSEASQGRLLCLKGRDTKDGVKNSYALAWKESLPDSAVLLEGLTFVSDTYFNHDNLWHGVSAVAPFVRWSMKNGCLRPSRWVLFHWGELRFKTGSWLENLMQASFGDVKVEAFNKGDGPYCFEKALVMRHDTGEMGVENKLKVFDLLRCKGRKFCGFNQVRRRIDVNERGAPIIKFTLLMRRGSRSFKNATAVTEIFAKECAMVEGCRLDVVQSEDQSFCDQVRVMSNSDIVASPHGAQLTNMFFMDRNSNVMEFFPKGWLEYAGLGQYAHHWMANQSGMKHQGAWWDPNGKDCPNPKDELECFLFHKDGQVGHNETYFAEWTKKVLHQVRLNKLAEATKDQASVQQPAPNVCAC